jgi:hypothetical protein
MHGGTSRVAVPKVKGYLLGNRYRYILLLKVAFQPASFQLGREKRKE